MFLPYVPYVLYVLSVSYVSSLTFLRYLLSLRWLETPLKFYCRLVTFRTVRFSPAAGYLQATLSNLLTYSVLRSTHPHILSAGREMSSSLRATG